MCRAAAPSRLLIRPATAAVTSPARGNSFRLIVKVSMGGRHFHGAVTPRHFYVAVATWAVEVAAGAREVYSRRRMPPPRRPAVMVIAVAAALVAILQLPGRANCSNLSWRWVALTL